MKTKARIVSRLVPDMSFEVGMEEILIGRSRDCGICLPEKYVSRRQGRIYFEGGQYVIENLGRNPIIVNGKEIDKYFLQDGDNLHIGTNEFIFQIEDSEPDHQETSIEDKTVFFSTPVNEESGPRVLLTSSDGQSKTYAVDKDIFIIGRLPEADIFLQDSAISRKHCVIEKSKDGTFIKNLSETNPLTFDSEPVKEKRLFSGDQFKIGSFIFSFFSDRPEDIRLEQSERTSLTAWLAISILLLIVITSVFYYQFYRPWEVRKTLKIVSTDIDEGNYKKAHETLVRMLDKNPPKEEAQRARKFLSRTAIILSQEIAANEELSDAKKFLINYLNKFGFGEKTRVVRDQLDLYRLSLGNQLEASGQFKEALREFSFIKEDSPYIQEAQQSISRLWLATQGENFKQQTVGQLLAEAGEHFQAKRYLTPVNKNAYAAYQAVLSIDANNVLAKERIEEIKAYFWENGEKYFNQENCSRALSYFEKYMIIDPQSTLIKEKVIKCRQMLADRRIPGKDKDKRREKIERLLEETGSEPAWIMKYLFEEDEQKESETPWE